MNTDYQFKVGDKGLTRDGDTSYEVIKTDAVLKNGKCVIAILTPHNRDFGHCNNFFSDGKLLESISSTIDLMPPTIEAYEVVFTYIRKVPMSTRCISNILTRVYASKELAETDQLRKDVSSWKITSERTVEITKS